MRQFFEHATGLSIYPLFSFVLFGLFFLGMLVWMFTRTKAYYHTLEQLPLMEEAADNTILNRANRSAQ